jgi:hypothetical protein
MTLPRVVHSLDLQANGATYQGDGGLWLLTERLGRAGHAATLTRLTARGADVAELAARARESLPEGVELVVVARAWSEALVAALRSVLPGGARLVRYSATGDAGALDGRFDFVVDDRGLRAFLAGDPSPAAPVFQPRRAAELRLLRDEPPSTPGLGGLPTLSGPSRGCPYLRDARRSPAFEGVDLGAPGLQTKGCTFCLDNDGAYVASSEEATVAAWLTRLRALRAETPGLLSVLLTDERPHAFLPRFFEALAEEPRLSPVELLVKSRVDWLLEGRGDLERAAERAAATGSVLHVYLVGFESFDPFHLELFNKGHGVEESRAAVALLRELGERFPSSFEYRRLRAHGIVLFTPWTSPEALLENARVMRELRFGELRSEAIRTRLRLYPRTPLHALAQRDGLLAERFPDLRPDRAAEQGYDASVPWRFRDARTEAIFEAATALAEHDRSIPDEDVLEVATRLVLRFPRLAATPGAAPALLLRAVTSWGAPLGTLGPHAAEFAYLDRELELLLAGRKRALLAEGVGLAATARLVDAARALGLAAAPVSTHELDEASGRHAAGSSRAIVCVACDEATLAEVTTAQRAVERGDAPAIRTMAELMGYPACCADAFASLPDRGDNLANERAPFARAPGATLSPWSNRLGRVRLVSHHLCRPDCAPSAELADAALEIVRRESPRAADWVRARVASPVLFLDYARRWELEGRFHEGSFEVERAEPIHAAPPLGAARRLRLRPRSVELERPDGTTHLLQAEAPLLLVPGAALDLSVAQGLSAPRALAPAGVASSTQPARPSLPPLPSMLAPGVRARAFVLRRVEQVNDEHRLELVRGSARLVVRIAGAPREGFVPVGVFHVRAEAEPALDEPARACLALVAEALHRGARGRRGG